MWILVIFGTLMAGYGFLFIGFTYRYRDRGDIGFGVSHATVLVVVGGLAVSGGLIHSWRTYLIAAFGSLLLGEGLALWWLGRKRRRDTGE